MSNLTFFAIIPFVFGEIPPASRELQRAGSDSSRICVKKCNANRKSSNSVFEQALNDGIAGDCLGKCLVEGVKDVSQDKPKSPITCRAKDSNNLIRRFQNWKYGCDKKCHEKISKIGSQINIMCHPIASGPSRKEQMRARGACMSKCAPRGPQKYSFKKDACSQCIVGCKFSHDIKSASELEECTKKCPKQCVDIEKILDASAQRILASLKEFTTFEWVNVIKTEVLGWVNLIRGTDSDRKAFAISQVKNTIAESLKDLNFADPWGVIDEIINLTLDEAEKGLNAIPAFRNLDSQETPLLN